ncbi:PSP1 C-terminal conserved region-domain-containing protein [Scheffersomyces coipomensis]|uniref:PSP1 C-terminal conserved region-domain-containing protein n=1 Tax=Scheffersomyces coipomensis TaxID=1788519 RepID=UPI00315D8387
MSLNNLPPHLLPQNSVGSSGAASNNNGNNNAPHPVGTTPPTHSENSLVEPVSSNHAVLSTISTTPPLLTDTSPSRHNSIWNTATMQPSTPNTNVTPSSNPPPQQQQSNQQSQQQAQRRASVDIWSQNNIWSQPTNNPSPPFLSSPSDSTTVNTNVNAINNNSNNNYYPTMPLSNKSSFTGISTNSSSNALFQQQQQPSQSQQQQQQSQGYPTTNQSMVTPQDDYQGYSPTSGDLNPFELRRHSYSDIYAFGNGNNNNTNNNQSVLAPAAPLPTSSSSGNMDSTFQLVNEYFETDPHERVKVTLKLLEERFFDEEKYLGEAYQLPKFLTENALRDCQLVLVGFKAGRIDVFYLPSNPSPDLINLKVGDLVIVEADRGKDLGKIFKLNISIDEARLMKLLQFQEQQAALNESEFVDEHLSVKQMSETNNSANPSVAPPTLHFPKPIVSLAQTNEIFQILNKKQDEEKACRLCLAKIVAATGQLSNGGIMNANSPISSPISTLSSSTQADLLQMKLIDAEYQFDRKKLIFYYSTSKRIDFRELVRELFRIYKTRIWMCAVVGLPYTLSGSSAVNLSMSTMVPPPPTRSSTGSNNSSFLNTSPTSSYSQTRLNDPFGNYNSNNQQQQQQQPQQQQTSQPQQQQQQVPHGFFDRRFSLQTTPQYQYSSMNNDLVQIPRRYLAEQQQSRPGPQQQQQHYQQQLQQSHQPGYSHVRSASFSQVPQQQQFWGQQQQPQQSVQQASYGQQQQQQQQPPLSSHSSQQSFQFHPSQQQFQSSQVQSQSQTHTPLRELPFRKEGEDGSTSSFSSTSGDSPFMLKSLVDSINH